MNVRNCLCFDSLRGIDDQKGALARGKAARKLHSEIDVPRSVEQVQSIVFSPDLAV